MRTYTFTKISPEGGLCVGRHGANERRCAGAFSDTPPFGAVRGRGDLRTMLGQLSTYNHFLDLGALATDHELAGSGVVHAYALEAEVLGGSVSVGIGE